MAAVSQLGDYEILNNDVWPENVLVRNADYFVVVIDFAQSRLRREDRSWQDCKEHKWGKDEEGAIGNVMRRKLGFKYSVYNGARPGTMRYFVTTEDAVSIR